MNENATENMNENATENMNENAAGNMNKSAAGNTSENATGNTSDNTIADNPEITMEAAFARLNEVLDKIENGGYSLEEVFGLYQEGLKLIRICEGKIDRIDKQLKVLNEVQQQ